jgi:hypothetical protein
VRTGSLGEALYLAAIGVITALYLAGIIPPLTFAPSW